MTGNLRWGALSLLLSACTCSWDALRPVTAEPPVFHVEPPVPRTDDTLKAVLVTPARTYGRHEPTYTFAWSRNGEMQPDLTGAVVGTLDTGEACDDGNADGCTNACALPRCGYGFVQTGEACDDGNSDDGDGCLMTCVKARCGNVVVRAGLETCDDGNTPDGDGCSATCQRTASKRYVIAPTTSPCTTPPRASSGSADSLPPR
jgi:cysteine-rich repeat protein